MPARRLRYLSIHGIKLPLGEHLSLTATHSILKGTYEKTEYEVLSQVLAKKDVIFELGTGLGFLSIYCAKKLGSENVFTFEANPRLEPFIKKAYELNKVSPSLQMAVLGASPGRRTFYIQDEFISSSLIKYGKCKKIWVKMLQLNAELERIRPTFIIMDIEGGEYELMKFIRLAEVKKILIEVHGWAIGQRKALAVVNKIISSGFNLKRNLSSYSLAGKAGCLYFERN